MAISPVNALGADTSHDSTSSRIPVRTLNQDDFLKLVIAQLTTQDPLHPQTDTDFVAQMAQFTTLEQSKAMTSDIAQLRSEQQIVQANSLIGRAVTLQDGQGALVQGTVSGVLMEAGTPQIVVNGYPFELSALLMIEPAADITQH
jgi:flagellar basal-body rod modification protein FlgD